MAPQMIDVTNLTKEYPGGIAAVRDVSFSLEAGGVMGLLGPNGAGKSTIMRILSGYLSPTGGDVLINGLDVTLQSLEVRKRIGYLPENCPLYTEMRVGEYLRYRADIKRVSRRHRAKRVDRVLEQCDLGDVRNRLIGTLSKGFRQRVGIADALVHSPDLLILDEPTIGLDPHQIVHIRRLIEDLARDHTLLISSHILSEIETTCSRVLVLEAGKVRDCGTIGELADRWLKTGEFLLEVEADEAAVRERLEEIEGVVDLKTRMVEGWVHCSLRMDGGQDPRAELSRLACEHDWPLRELHRCERHLEDAFLSMTGTADRKTEARV